MPPDHAPEETRRLLHAGLDNLSAQVENLLVLRDLVARQLTLCETSVRASRRLLSGPEPATVAGRPTGSAAFWVGHLEVIPQRQSVRNRGRLHMLTRTEWQLFSYLLDHAGQTLSRPQLAEGAWGSAYSCRSGEVEVYISRLRSKIEPQDPDAPRLLRTVRGAGYVLDVPHATGDARQAFRRPFAPVEAGRAVALTGRPGAARSVPVPNGHNGAPCAALTTAPTGAPAPLPSPPVSASRVGRSSSS